MQVVVAAIPGSIIEFTAGYLFGLWHGTAALFLGAVLGSAFNFYLARVLGRPALERLIKPATLDKVDNLLDRSQSKMALFLLFLLPETPKDYMCYGAGFTRMAPAEFILLSSLARAPVMLATALLGSQAHHHDYRAMIVTGGAVLLASGLVYAYQRRRSRQAKGVGAGAPGLHLLRWWHGKPAARVWASLGDVIAAAWCTISVGQWRHSLGCVQNSQPPKFAKGTESDSPGRGPWNDAA